MSFIVLCGWCIETIYCNIIGEKGKRGFLNGPYCPIYGFGGLLICYLLIPFRENVFLIFILSILISIILEYITGYILEKIYNRKWWDYSKRKLNVCGRVCLGNSFLFGIMGVITIYFIHPFIVDAITSLDVIYVPIFALVILIIFISDLIITVNRLNVERA